MVDGRQGFGVKKRVRKDKGVERKVYLTYSRRVEQELASRKAHLEAFLDTDGGLQGEIL